MEGKHKRTIKKFDDSMNIVFVFADLDVSEKMAGYQPEWNCRALK
jgi:hypothetical protein